MYSAAQLTKNLLQYLVPGIEIHQRYLLFCTAFEL